MVDYKVRALYYMYLIGGPWKFEIDTSDPEPWEYIREISEIVYDGIGDNGMNDYMVFVDGEQISNIIIKDIQYAPIS